MSLTIEEVIERLQRLKAEHGPNIEVKVVTGYEVVPIREIRQRHISANGKPHIEIKPA